MALVLNNTRENVEKRADKDELEIRCVEHKKHRFLISDFNSRQCLLCKYEGEGGAVTVPEGVTSIGPSCFTGCKSLTKITFPKTLKNIHGAAFFNCTELKSVVIPEGVTYIDKDAFSYCRCLTSVWLPDSLTYIGARAFFKCANLKDLRLPCSISLKQLAFTGCHGLADQNGLVIVGNHVFDYCGNSKTLRIPEGVTEIAAGAFYESGVENVIFPVGLKYIRSKSFADCVALKCVRIPENIEEVDWDAFDCGVRVEVPERILQRFEPYCPENWAGY